MARNREKEIAVYMNTYSAFKHKPFNTIGEINKRAAVTFTTAFAGRKSRGIKIRDSLAAIDCCFDILALWHFDGEHAHVFLLLLEFVWRMVRGRLQKWKKPTMSTKRALIKNKERKKPPSWTSKLCARDGRIKGESNFYWSILCRPRARARTRDEKTTVKTYKGDGHSIQSRFDDFTNGTCILLCWPACSYQS